MIAVDEILDSTIRLLSSHGYNVGLISYPEKHERRSIDIVASRVNEEPLLVKVVADVRDLRPGELGELRDCGKVLDAASIVVAYNDHGEEIDDIVAHERSGVFVVSVNGLRSALENSIYVVKRQGNYYMRIDGEKLRTERERYGYGLGDLAYFLSVSRRAVYMYEREESDVSLQVALRIMEIFGENVFKPINILNGSKTIQKSQKTHHYVSSRLNAISSAIENAGGEMIETKRAPSDAVARIDDDKMIIVLNASREETFIKKVHESIKVASPVDAQVIAIIRQASRRVIEEKFDDHSLVSIYRSIEEFANEIKYEQRA